MREKRDMRRVAVERSGDDLARAVRLALDRAGILARVTRTSRVALKPNLCLPSYKPGVTTSPQVIAETARVLRELTPHVAIVETDGGNDAWRAADAFRGHGVLELAKELDLQVVNLCEEPRQMVPIGDGSRQIPLPTRLLRDTDLLITLPVPKIHSLTGLSLAYKNQWGVVPDVMRLRRHHLFDDAIVTIDQVLRPAVLGDGTYFLDRNGPQDGEPVRMDLVIGASDAGAFDRYVSELMGWSWRQVPHLVRAEAANDLPRRLDEISFDEPPSAVSTHRFRLRRNVRNWLALAGFKSRWLTWLGYESWFGRVPLHALMYALVGRPEHPRRGDASRSDQLPAAAPSAVGAKLRCVHFLAQVRLEKGGVIRAALDMCAVLAAHGHDVTLLTFDAQDVPPRWRSGEPGLPRVIALAGYRSRLRRIPASAAQACHDALAPADIVHLHGMWQGANLQLGDWARRLDKPYVLSAHGMLADWSMSQRRLKKWLFWWLAGRRHLERAQAVHCTAKAEAEQTRRWLPRGRGAVIPYIIDLGAFTDLPGSAQAQRRFALAAAGPPVVLFLGRLDKKKGVDVLIRACGLLKRQRVAHRLVIAGPSGAIYLARLKTLATRVGLDDAAAAFVGTVVGAEKLSLYQAAAVLALPTRHENFGLVLVEALACRTPVVTTRGVDIWRELESAGAWIVDPTPEALATTLRAALADPAGLRARGERGRAWVAEAFDPHRATQAYEAMYRGGA